MSSPRSADQTRGVASGASGFGTGFVFHNLLPVGVGADSAPMSVAYSPVPTSAPPKAGPSGTGVSPFGRQWSTTGRVRPSDVRVRNESPPRSVWCENPDVAYFLTWAAVIVVAFSALSFETVLADASRLTTETVRVVVSAAAALSWFLAAWRTFLLVRAAIYTYRKADPRHVGRSRSFSDVLSVFALNVLALSVSYTLASVIDPHSIRNASIREPGRRHVIFVFFDSVYDMTLVASGTGFGERIPVGAGAKFVAFLCAAYLTIGLSMTIFARMLSSAAMYSDRGYPVGSVVPVREG